MEAIKFANLSPFTRTAKYNFPYFPSRAAPINEQEIKMASFLIKREVGVRSIPFGGGLGHKSSPRLAKVLSCVLCSTSSQICFN